MVKVEINSQCCESHKTCVIEYQKNENPMFSNCLTQAKKSTHRLSLSLCHREACTHTNKYVPELSLILIPTKCMNHRLTHSVSSSEIPFHFPKIIFFIILLEWTNETTWKISIYARFPSMNSVKFASLWTKDAVYTPLRRIHTDTIATDRSVTVFYTITNLIPLTCVWIESVFYTEVWNFTRLKIWNDTNEIEEEQKQNETNSACAKTTTHRVFEAHSIWFCHFWSLSLSPRNFLYSDFNAEWCGFLQILASNVEFRSKKIQLRISVSSRLRQNFSTIKILLVLEVFY